MSLKVFFDLISQPARSVVIFCTVNKLNFTPCAIAFRKHEQKSPEYAKINPFKKVPAIQDGDFVLTESSAILGYLASKYKCAEHWNPDHAEQRARVQEFIAWHGTELRPYTAGYFVNKVVVPAQTGNPVDEKVLSKQWSNMMKAFSSIESYFLQDKPFVAGEKISIADLIVACEVFEVAGTGLEFTQDHPILKSWLHRVRERTNPSFDEAHKIIYKIGNVSDPSKI